jgi:hypothetical protein
MDIFKTLRGRTIILALTFILLGFLYFSPRIELSEQFTVRYPRPVPLPTASPAQKLLEMEFVKTVEEIKFLLQLQDTWYNYKYLFIGALLAILLGQAGMLKYIDETSHQQPDHASPQSVKPVAPNVRSLKEIFSSGLVYLAVAFACVICLMIDMHIRRHMLSMQYLGLWISHFAEPAFLGSTDQLGGFLPWEQFVRAKLDDGNKPFYQNIWEGLQSIALTNQLHYLSTVTFSIKVRQAWSARFLDFAVNGNKTQLTR